MCEWVSKKYWNYSAIDMDIYIYILYTILWKWHDIYIYTYIYINNTHYVVSAGSQMSLANYAMTYNVLQIHMCKNMDGAWFNQNIFATLKHLLSYMHTLLHTSQIKYIKCLYSACRWMIAFQQ